MFVGRKELEVVRLMLKKCQKRGQVKLLLLIITVIRGVVQQHVVPSFWDTCMWTLKTNICLIGSLSRNSPECFAETRSWPSGTFVSLLLIQKQSDRNYLQLTWCMKLKHGN